MNGRVISVNRPFSLLIKPASADCNLRCHYCFYQDRAGLYPGTHSHRMSDEVLERVISSYMSTEQPQFAFGWQGGEPTLMGAAFFRRVTELQQRYGHPGSVVANGLQTNATLLDDELCETLAEYKFLVGVSLDGPEEIHDRYRLTPDGRGSHTRVLQGIEVLRRHGVEFNVLTLVTGANQERGAEIYRYLRDLGVDYHQYIPCVEFDGRGEITPFSVTPEAWGRFLCGLFEEWYPRDVGRVSIRLFDALISRLTCGHYELCHMGGDCRRYFVVEHNGDIYPCDFFVRPELRLGNIRERDWDFLLESPIHAAFSHMKTAWPQKCKGCEYLSLCSADCLKHRGQNGDEPANSSWLCDGWRYFYRRTLPRFRELTSLLRKERGLPVVNPREPGRNEPCFCGSGKKYKRCHAITGQ